MATEKQALLSHDGGAAGGGGHSSQSDEKRNEQLMFDRANTMKDTGLSEGAVPGLREQWGFNELEEEETNPFLQFLGYFWGPMPGMIWAAILIELAKAASGNGGWEDFGVLMVLQIVNGTVGYIEEMNAGNAIAALKEKLKPQCTVVRDGTAKKIDAKLLVPGDIVEIKLGDVVPADLILLGDVNDVEDQLQVDESALTGESLPVTVHASKKLKMSAMIKQGEGHAVVAYTGANTFYGRAAELMKITDAQGRFQKILFRITLGLLFLSVVLCMVILIKLLVATSSGQYMGAIKMQSGHKSDRVLEAISIVVVLLVASIPIAMQVVCTSTMAVGSRRLTEKKVIVARLSAIEELAGMTVLCSDKTGTLTKNILTLNAPVIYNKDTTEDQLNFWAALSANFRSTNMDAIDKCVVDRAAIQSAPLDLATIKDSSKYQITKYIPFNPTIKRTEVQCNTPSGFLRVTKGAPQIVLNMALDTNPNNDPALGDTVRGQIQDLAERGYRALSLAISRTPEGQEPVWEFQGLISIFDPPRDDTMETIKQAVAGGVEVKMITGDQKAIAVETCRQLEMGTEIFTTDVLDDPSVSDKVISERIYHANGFAEVMPEHKFNIVQALRDRGIVVGMTGDGVNDAPALKRADIGIAVEGATDAAKAAADIVLTEPGLSVIIDAILRSRKIFQRMRNYAIYRIACTIQLLFFFFFAVISIVPTKDAFYGTQAGLEKEGFPMAAGPAFSLPVISLVIITILNDGTIITIAHDKVVPANTPQKWDLWEVLVVSCVLGLTACVGSMILLVFAMKANFAATGKAYGGPSSGVDPSGNPYQGVAATNETTDTFFRNVLGSGSAHWITYGHVQTIMYLKISLSDFLTVFAARTRGWFFERRPGYALASAFVFATSCSTILAAFWPFKESSKSAAARGHYAMKPLKDRAYAILTTWIFCLIFFLIQDAIKVATYWVLDQLDENRQRIAEVERRSRLTNLAATEARGQGIMTAGGMGGGISAGAAKKYDDRISKLEREITQLKAMLQQGGAAAGGGAAGH